MKRTAKYNAALTAASTVLDKAQMRRVRLNNAALYDALEFNGWFWDAEAGQWLNYRRSTSMFSTDEGLPTGEFRLRLMAHPGDMPRLIEVVTEALDTYGATVTETSNGYPNRRGPGLRVYMTARLPDPKSQDED